MSATQFKKTTKNKPKRTPVKGLVPPKPSTPKSQECKTPVTRVGENRGHRDTIATRAYYVLLDDPNDPQDTVVLEHPGQHFPQMLTTDSVPLYDSILTYLLAFEPVAEGGALTLKLERGDSGTTVELFAKVPENDVMLNDADVFQRCSTKDGAPPRTNLRVPDYTTVPPRPFYSDSNLDQKPGPHSALRGGGE